MERIRKKHAQKIRYSIVGVANTVLDFALLFAFVGIGVNKIPANYLSTGIAMLFSFYGNRRYTFKNRSEQKKRQFSLFVIVTVIGMWGIQPLVIWSVLTLMNAPLNSESIQLFIAKSIATVASLIWNYALYSRVVFKHHHEKH